jgi:hypothetical protein
MHLLKPIAIKVKDPAKLPDTSRNALISLVRSPQNPAGRLLLDKTYDVYGITETQARSWSFLLVAETNEMVWIDMEYCLFSEPTPYIPTPVKEEPVETVAPIETKRKSKKVEEIEESIGHS